MKENITQLKNNTVLHWIITKTIC